MGDYCVVITEHGGWSGGIDFLLCLYPDNAIFPVSSHKKAPWLYAHSAMPGGGLSHETTVIRADLAKPRSLLSIRII